MCVAVLCHSESFLIRPLCLGHPGEGVWFHLTPGPVAHHPPPAHQEDHPGRRRRSEMRGSWKRCSTEGRIHHACFHTRNDTHTHTHIHLTVSGDERWWLQVFYLLTATPSDHLILAFLPSLSECKSSRPHLCPEVLLHIWLLKSALGDFTSIFYSNTCWCRWTLHVLYNYFIDAVFLQVILSLLCIRF